MRTVVPGSGIELITSVSKNELRVAASALLLIVMLWPQMIWPVTMMLFVIEQGTFEAVKIVP